MKIQNKKRRSFLKSIAALWLTGSAGRAFAINGYELKSDVPITRFPGVSIIVRSFTDEQGVNTKVKKCRFTLKMYFTPKNTLAEKAQVPIYYLRDDKVEKTVSIDTSLRARPSEDFGAMLSVEFTVDEPYYGLASGDSFDIFHAYLKFVDEKNKPLLHDYINTSCLQYKEKKPGSEYGEVVASAFMSPVDMLVVKKDGKPFIQPLFYEVRCIADSSGEKAVRKIYDLHTLQTELAHMQMPDDKRITPRMLFSARAAYVVCWDQKSNKSIELLSIPPELIDAINKAFVDTVSLHEADFRDSKGEERNLSGCFITTAACEILRRSDNCWELNMLRKFRDRYLSKSDIAEYENLSKEILYGPMRSSISLKFALVRFYFVIALPGALLAALHADRLTYKLYRYGAFKLLRKIRDE